MSMTFFPPHLAEMEQVRKNSNKLVHGDWLSWIISALMVQMLSKATHESS